MRNNNGAVVRRLSVRSLRSSKMRNFFAISAIMLTCMLFTAAFSLFSGAAQVSQESTMREVGTRSHAGLKEVTMEQYEKTAADPLVKQSCYNILIGLAANLQKRQAEIRYTPDEAMLYDCFITLKEGRFPDAPDEIIADTIVLDELGIEHAVGAKLPLEFTFLGQKYEKEFTVSGWYEGDFVSHASQLFISESCWLDLKGDRTDEDIQKWAKEHPEDNGAGLLSANFMFDNASGIEEKVRTVIANAGYESELEYGVNWAYMESRFSNVDIVSIVLLAGAVGVILLTGYLIIYNIFQISVMNDIRFYGLLKTIGTTKKQLRRLIFRQAAILSLMGIPAGLVLGFLVGKLALPVSMSYMDYDNIEISLAFDPLIFIFGAVFSAVTVILSCRRPGKIAGRVSPAEAVTYTEGAYGADRKRKKKRRRNFSPLRMALANLGRDKGKTAVVLASISFSMILLTLVVTAVRSFQLDHYFASRLTGDFLLGDINLLGNAHGVIEGPKPDYVSLADAQDGILEKNELWIGYGKNIKIDEKGLAEYQKLAADGKLRQDEYTAYGVEQILNGNNDLLSGYVYGYESPLFENLEVLEGTLDIEKFQNGDYILLAQFFGNSHLDAEDSLYHPGDMVTVSSITEDSTEQEIKDENGETVDIRYDNRKEKQYEVMAIVSIPISLTTQRTAPNAMDAVLPYREFSEPAASDCNCFAVSYQVEENMQPAFEAAIKNYTENIDTTMAYESKSVLKQEFDGMLHAVSMIGIVLAAVIAFIGILNFINAMLTGIIARKHEFAILQSIGMTNKQLKQMLVCEGISYVMASGVISLCFGSLLAWQVLGALNHVLMFFEYRFQLLPFFLMVPVLLVVAVAGPIAAYRQLRKKSIVERLREAD